jgi:hypothetical protein
MVCEYVYGWLLRLLAGLFELETAAVDPLIKDNHNHNYYSNRTVDPKRLQEKEEAIATAHIMVKTRGKRILS